MNCYTWLRKLWDLDENFNDIDDRLDSSIAKIAYLMDQITYQREQILKLSKEVKELKEKQKTIPIDIVEEDKSKVKVNKYYDPQMNVEYVDIEINGEKASPDEDTVKE